MPPSDQLPEWAPKVPQETIRRLYATDAQGILDPEQIAAVGWALWARCDSILTVTTAHYGKVRCPSCDGTITRQEAWAIDEQLACATCGWQLPWVAYHQTYRGKQLFGGNAVEPFAAYHRAFPQTQEPAAQMHQIDALIHTFHVRLREVGRPAAANLIAGSLRAAIQLLGELAGGEASAAGLGDSRTAWRQTLVLTRAAALLSAHLGTALTLTPIDAYATWVSHTWRCRLQPQPADFPATVIVKHTVPRPEPAYADWHQHAFLHEWAALDFLGALDPQLPLAPAFYTGDIAERIVVMEDLGTGSTSDTYDLLFGTDPDQAHQSLIAHVALLGRLHAATAPVARDYLPIRAALGPEEPEKPLFCHPWSRARLRRSSEAELQAAVQRYRAVLASIGLAQAGDIASEIALVAARVEDDPGPFLAYAKGDQEVPNDAIHCGGQLRLIDFNVGGLRHALVEGLPGRLTWGCHRRLPPDLVRQLDDTYQRELALGCPAAADQGPFWHAATLAAARWHLFHVTWRLPHALRADGPRGPTGTTLRQQFLAWTDAFSDLAGDGGPVPQLAATARQLASRLRAVWPADIQTLPMYPAFEQ